MKIKKNGKVITLTESDLQRIVKRVIKESEFDGGDYETEMFKVMVKDCDEPKRGNVIVTADGIAYIEYCRGDREELERLKNIGRERIKGRFNNSDMY